MLILQFAWRCNHLKLPRTNETNRYFTGQQLRSATKHDNWFKRKCTIFFMFHSIVTSQVINIRSTNNINRISSIKKTNCGQTFVQYDAFYSSLKRTEIFARAKCEKYMQIFTKRMQTYKMQKAYANVHENMCIYKMQTHRICMKIR